MTMTDHIYRVMPPDLKSRSVGGSPGYQYALGEWTERIENPVLCERGYHTLTAGGILEYAQEGDVLVRCEVEGQVPDGGTKRTNASVRPVEIIGTLDATTLRLHAADCADDAARHYRERYPYDPTLDVVIHTVRAYALGGATDEERRLARDAAYASYAAYAAYTATSASAAYAATDAAAYAAAYADAYADAYAYAAREEPRERLGQMLVERVRGNYADGDE